MASSACLASTRPAPAQLLVALGEGSTSVVEHAELAYAFGAAAPVTWVSLRVAEGKVALVAPLAEGAAASASLDAWLSALEDTATLRIVPEPSKVSCGTPEPARVSWPRDPGRAPAAELLLADASDVTSALAAFDLSLPAALGPAPAYAVWVWEGEGLSYTTRTLRLLGDGALPVLHASASFPVVVDVLARGPMTQPGSISRDELEITFKVGLNRTDYLAQAYAWFAAERAPIVETRARGAIFDWAIYDDRLTLAPLVESYVERAARESQLPSAAGCVERLLALQAGGGFDGADCGAADDLALALGASSPEAATLLRLLTWSSLDEPFDPAALEPGGEPLRVLATATKVDNSLCTPVQEPPLRGGGSDEGVAEPPPPVEDEPAVVIYDPYYYDHPSDEVVGCSGSTEPEPEYEDRSSGCGSDASSSQEDEDCSSDSSSSSSSSDDGACSSDSSSSSSSDDGACSSDSSSTGSDDTSCDGGTEGDTGYDGDTCTGSAAPKAEPARASRAGLTRGTRAARPSRLRFSLWSVALAALVLPIRRRNRRTSLGY